MKKQCLLRLNIPPDLEEDAVDLLLALDGASSFQSFSVRGHGGAGAMSIAEQVEGRRNRIQFEIMLDEDLLDSVLAKIKNSLSIPDSFYTVTPISISGRL